MEAMGTIQYREMCFAAIVTENHKGRTGKGTTTATLATRPLSILIWMQKSA